MKDNATSIKRKAALKEELEKVEDFIKEYNSSLTNMLKEFSEEIEKYDDKDRNTYMNILKKTSNPIHSFVEGFSLYYYDKDNTVVNSYYPIIPKEPRYRY